MVNQLNRSFSRQLNQNEYDPVYQFFARNEVTEIAALTEYRLWGIRPWKSVSTSNQAGRYGGISRVGVGDTNYSNIYGTPNTPITNPN